MSARSKQLGHAFPRKRSWAAVAVAGAIIAAGGSAFSAVEWTPGPDNQDRVIHRGGVVRVGTSVYLHTNGTHASVGLTQTRLIRKCYLQVVFDRAVGEKIVSAVVDEDETLSRKGIQAGVSGGAGTLNIYLYRYDGRPVCANNRSLGSQANLWIDVQTLAPEDVKPEDLKPAPVPHPAPEAEQMTVPPAATAPVPVVPAIP